MSKLSQAYFRLETFNLSECLYFDKPQICKKFVLTNSKPDI